MDAPPTEAEPRPRRSCTSAVSRLRFPCPAAAGCRPWPGSTSRSGAAQPQATTLRSVSSRRTTLVAVVTVSYAMVYGSASLSSSGQNSDPRDDDERERGVPRRTGGRPQDDDEDLDDDWELDDDDLEDTDDEDLDGDWDGEDWNADGDDNAAAEDDDR